MHAAGTVRRAGAMALASLLIFLFAGTGAALADAGFQRWIADFRKTATASGIKPAVFDRAFRGITAPDPEVLEKARYQPEFKAAIWDYIDGRVNERAIITGREMARQWKPWLDLIEQKFGVSRTILLAIWSVESNYGRIFENPAATRSIVRSLATLGYADSRRSKFARTQLVSALKILQSGHIDVGHLTGSWAGAMGHTQFIPTSYQAFSVDMDRDGRADIWSSVPDALATAANLLAKGGWQSGKTWGYEVTLPAGRKFPAGSLTLDQWAALGVTRANGKPFPRGSDKAELKVLDGPTGPAFLMTRNFFVIKKYNNADTYALAVGLLADQIGGYGGLVRDWNRPYTRLTSDESEELQRRLSALGYYEGKVDGLIGEGSRSAIRAFQAQQGLTQDGHPSKEVLTNLRRR